MSIVIRSDEEVNELMNEISEAFDEGNSLAGAALETMEWMTNPEVPKPKFMTD